METAVDLAAQYFANLNVGIHKPEGAFFLWAWFKNLSISCRQLYERLKKRGVIVVPGNYFFFGLTHSHPHADQCLRINYAQEENTVEAAFKIIADEVYKTVD